MSLRITSTHIRALDKLDFTDFCNHLLRAESRRAGVPQHLVNVTLRIDNPDGGVDAAIRALDCPGTAWLSAGESVWQYRSGRQSAADIRQCLEAKGACGALKSGKHWCLACGEDYEDPAWEGLKQAAAEWCLENECDSCLLRMYSASMLSEWGNEIPATAYLPYFPLPRQDLSRFETWQGAEAGVPWIADADREHAIADIRLWLDGGDPTRCFRIEGAAGVGKTRLALEAIRGGGWEEFTLYAQDPKVLEGTGFAGYCENSDVLLVLVLDECELRESALWEKWSERCSGKVRLITVGTEPELEGSERVIVLRSMEDECIRQILKGIGGLDPAMVEFIVDVSEGYVKLAVALAEALRGKRQLTASELPRQTPVRIALDTLSGDRTNRAALQALSLLRRVGIDGEAATEGEAVAKFIGVQFSELQQCAAQMQGSIVSRRGRYRYVTPKLLAVWLASEVWEARSEEIVDKLYPLLPSDMSRRSLLERLRDLGSEQLAARTLEVMLGPGGALAAPTLLEDDIRAEILSLMSETAPAAGVRALERLLEGVSKEALAGMSKSRRKMVWMLQKAVWFPDAFFDAARLLLQLAEAENETFGNNATGVWASLFQTHLAPTCIPALERHCLIDEALRSQSTERRHLAVVAAQSALETHEVGEVYGEVQGGRVAPERWRPETWEDDSAVRRSALRFLDAAITDQDASIRREAKSVLISKWGGLMHIGLGDDVLCRLEQLLPEDLDQANELRSHLRSIAEAEADSGLSEELRRRAGELLQRLSGSTFSERLRVAVSAYDFLHRDEAEAKLAALAEAAPACDGELEGELPWLCSAEARMSYAFGAALGAADSGLLWLGRIAVASADATNVGLIVGYVGGVLPHQGPEWLEDTLDGWLADGPVPATALVAMSGRYTPTVRAAARLRDMVERGIATGEMMGLHFIEWQNQAPLDAFVTVVRLMLEAESIGAAGTAMMMVEQRLQGDDSREQLALLAWECLERRPELAVSSGMEEFHWHQLAGKVLDSDPGRVARCILSVCGGHNVHLYEERRVVAVLQEALRKAPQTVWPMMADRMHGDNACPPLTWGLRGYFGRFVETEVLIRWAKEHGDVGPKVVARATPVAGSPLYETARQLLVTFGDEEAGHELEANFMSGGFSGPTSLHLKGKLEQVRVWKDDKEEAVRLWAARLEQRLLGEIRDYEQLEAEDELHW